MPRIKLSDAADTRVLFGKEISSMEKIYFVSDVGCFDSIAAEQILSEIIDKKYEIVVFAGNTLSFLRCGIGAPMHLLNHYEAIYDVFLGRRNEPKRKPEFKQRRVSEAVSKYLLWRNRDVIKAYRYFVERCRELKVPIIYFTGNRDFILNRYQKDWFSPSNMMPVIKLIKNETSVSKRQGYVYYPPGELELVRLGSDLYILGVNTTDSGEYPSLRKLAELEDPVEEPRKIILVSHTPGTEKYRKCGSKDITDLKRKLKFRFHIHGHCDKYYGVYIGVNGTPSKSAHFERAITK